MEGAVGWQNVLPTSPQKTTLDIYVKKNIYPCVVLKSHMENPYLISINHITDLSLAKFAIGQVQ